MDENVIVCRLLTVTIRLHKHRTRNAKNVLRSLPWLPSVMECSLEPKTQT